MELPEPVGHSVKARCPDCGGAIAVFDFKDSGRESGYIVVDRPHEFNGKRWSSIHYRLLRCAGCGRGGLSKFHDNGSQTIELEDFYPHALQAAPLPATVPVGVQKEYREAELCASVKAYRAASTLVRSALEKTLQANGYTAGSLRDRIDEASADGVITASRQRRAHEDIRVLGNEVVHEDWRHVTEEEAETALHYAQRILEDLYDDRRTVEAVLVAKKRINGTNHESEAQ